MTEIESRLGLLQRLIDYGNDLKESTSDPRKNLNSWIPSVKTVLPRSYLKRITRLSLFSSKRIQNGQRIYRIIESDIDIILPLLKDEMLKLIIDTGSEREMFALRIIGARETSDNLERSLAERICGENSNFPNGIYLDIENFFFNLGHHLYINPVYPVNSTTDFLMTLDSLQLLDLVQYGLFNKKYYRMVDEKESKQSFDLKAFQRASDDFNFLLNELSIPNEPVSLSQIFNVNQTYDLMFYTDYETADASLNSLLKEARRFFLINEYQIAIEKVWDAFERLKTVLNSDKLRGVNQLIEKMSIDIDKDDNTQEFKYLSDVGNQYNIRHHETGKTKITNDVEKRYLYFRMLALIDYALHSIKSSEKIS
jgi:hypothetical protein